MKKEQFRQLYGIVTSAMVLLCGALLCIQCVRLCLSGPQPFSRESVAAFFSPIALPVYLCLAMIVLGFLFPASVSKKKKTTNHPGTAVGTGSYMLPIFLLSAGICMVLYGLFTGGAVDVLTKAINICTECVGLG